MTPDNPAEALDLIQCPFVGSSQVKSLPKQDISASQQDAPASYLALPVTFRVGPSYAEKVVMKVVAAKEEDRKALDYFSSTIIPARTLGAVAKLTLKHAMLLVGFTAVVMALVRLLLAD